MAINESVQGVLAQHSWKQRTLVEVANAGQLFMITEAEFDRILEAEQLDEGVKEWIAKAREFAKKLPANIQQAQQLVAQKTGKALDAGNAVYVKAQNIINKIPLIGRIPETTRNRLLLGLAMSFAAGMGSEMSAGETGGGETAGTDPPAADPTPAAEPAPAAEPPAAEPVNMQPDPHAQAIGKGTEGNKVFADMMKDAGASGNTSMLRQKFHMVCDRMAAGDVGGAKMSASNLADQMHLDDESKKGFMNLLMKIGQTAKANGVKMR